MASLWDDIKKSLGEWVAKAADKAGEFTKEAAEKAGETTKLGKIRLDIFQIKRDIEKNFADLGGRVYHLITEEEVKNVEKEEKVTAIIEKIKELEKKLKEKEAEYEEVRKSTQKTEQPKEKPGKSEGEELEEENQQVKEKEN
jgi:hypothetical protein